MTDEAQPALRATLQRVWGYASFLPLQEDATAAVLAGRDSLVVLPTGGGIVNMNTLRRRALRPCPRPLT